MQKDTKTTDSQDFSIFQTIFYYVALIISAPIIVFFGTKVVLLEGLFGATNVSSSVWAAIAAILMLHIIVGMYIYRAYSEGGKSKPEKID